MYVCIDVFTKFIYYQREQDKKDKEMAKRLVKKEKKNIKALLKPALEADEYLGEKLDVLFEKLDIKGLEVFRDSLESVKESGIETLVCTLESKVSELLAQK